MELEQRRILRNQNKFVTTSSSFSFSSPSSSSSSSSSFSSSSSSSSSSFILSLHPIVHLSPFFSLSFFSFCCVLRIMKLLRLGQSEFEQQGIYGKQLRFSSLFFLFFLFSFILIYSFFFSFFS